MTELRVTVFGLDVVQAGPPPFAARSAGRTDAWPLWMIVAADGVTGARFPADPAATLCTRDTAIAAADALNAAARQAAR